jgi:hypothetical protein
VANLEREGLTRERGEYETDYYTRHRDAIVSESAVGTALRGGPNSTVAGPFADLLGYQRTVANLDAAWSTGAGAAKNSFESALSDAYYAHATAENGTLGSVPTRIHASGQATSARITGLADSDKTLSIDSTDNLAEFTKGETKGRKGTGPIKGWAKGAGFHSFDFRGRPRERRVLFRPRFAIVRFCHVSLP